MCIKRLLRLVFLPPLGASDPKILTFKFQCYCSYTNSSSTHYNYYKGDYESIRRELNTDWVEELGDNDVNIMLQRFMDRVNRAQEKFTPRSRPFPRKGTIPQCKTTVEANKRKHRSWTRYLESRDERSYKSYVKARKKVK